GVFHLFDGGAPKGGGTRIILLFEGSLGLFERLSLGITHHCNILFVCGGLALVARWLAESRGIRTALYRSLSRLLFAALSEHRRELQVIAKSKAPGDWRTPKR